MLLSIFALLATEGLLSDLPWEFLQLALCFYVPVTAYSHSNINCQGGKPQRFILAGID